jgi:SPP1 gp7 family putative phage head morphogenesis protein
MVRRLYRSGKPKVLPAVYPNAGVEAAYQRKLDRLIDEMGRSVQRWMTAAYRYHEPELATDASPAKELNRVFDRLARRWQDRFDELAPELARHFSSAALAATDASFAAAMRKGGMTVRFGMTRQVNDAFQASIAENVGLIRSIPAEYLQQVQGILNRSVQRGRDLELFTQELQERFSVVRSRAVLIARDQNSKATSVITAARQREVGITQARWVHSGAGRHPRASHVKASREGLIYNVAEGALIDGKRIWPGSEINCRCTARSIISGL